MLGSKNIEELKKRGKVVFNSRFLQNLTLLERAEFLQYCHRREYKEGEHIYYQGDPGTGMYFIEEGKVALIIEPEPGHESQSHSYTITAPESFGALSIGYEVRRKSSVKCLSDCTLLGFFKPDLETLKKRHPGIAVKFMETLAMVAMKQLEVMTRELKKCSGTEEALSLQFETYLDAENRST